MQKTGYENIKTYSMPDSKSGTLTEGQIFSQI